jgi:hypothetical protein
MVPVDGMSFSLGPQFPSGNRAREDGKTADNYIE